MKPIKPENRWSSSPAEAEAGVLDDSGEQSTAHQRALMRSELLSDLDQMGWGKWVESGRKALFDQLVQGAASISAVEVKTADSDGHDQASALVEPTTEPQFLEFVGQFEPGEQVSLERMIKFAAEPRMGKVDVRPHPWKYENGISIWTVVPKFRFKLNGLVKKRSAHVATKVVNGAVRVYMVSPTKKDNNSSVHVVSSSAAG